MSKNKYRIIALVSATAIISLTFALYSYALQVLSAADSQTSIVERTVCPQIDIEEEIRRQAKLFDLDVEKMVNIAKCESGLDPNARNLSSTANGIFQILDGTWEHHKCKGGISDPVDNIKCAMKVATMSGYNQWVCNY